MKKWLIVLFGLVVLVSGATYVLAERSNVHTITITDAGFQPTKITVKQNTVLKITVVNKGTKKHNLTIPAYFIFTHNLNVGESTDVEFTVNKTGNFPYLSDTPGQPEAGLQGTLTVE